MGSKLNNSMITTFVLPSKEIDFDWEVLIADNTVMIPQKEVILPEENRCHTVRVVTELVSRTMYVRKRGVDEFTRYVLYCDDDNYKPKLYKQHMKSLVLILKLQLWRYGNCGI
jgi:hypothetical protein